MMFVVRSKGSLATGLILRILVGEGVPFPGEARLTLAE
jgi:hypothetical protein